MNFDSPKPNVADLVPPGGFDPGFFDDERHHDVLEQLAVQALSSGDFKAAFKYADRAGIRFVSSTAFEYDVAFPAASRGTDE